MKSKLLFVCGFVVVVAFCWLSIACWDAPVAISCRSIDKKIRLAFDVIAAFGYALFYLIAFFLAALVFKYVYKSNYYSLVSLFFFLSIAGSGLVADALKFILGRSRPNLLWKENIYYFHFFQIERDMTSFPSGHATTITSLMLALYFFYPKYKYFYIAAAILVAGSRVLIAAHYLSDVVFGAYLGLVITPYVKRRFEKEGGKIFGTDAAAAAWPRRT